jgi:hypothetical protein
MVWAHLQERVFAPASPSPAYPEDVCPVAGPSKSEAFLKIIDRGKRHLARVIKGRVANACDGAPERDLIHQRTASVRDRLERLISLSIRFDVISKMLKASERVPALVAGTDCVGCPHD